MDWCDVGRGRLAAEAFGDPTAPAVLLIAGGGGAMWSWSRLLPEAWPVDIAPVEAMSPIESLATRYRVAVFDQAGVGESAGVAPAASADEAAADAISVGRMLLGDRFAIVGMSLGGAAAIRAALHYPDVVGQLVLVCTFPSLTMFVSPPATSPDDTDTNVAAQVRHSLQPWFRDEHPRLVDSVVGATLATAVHPDLQQRSIDVFLSHDHHDLGALEAQTVVVCGDQDAVFPMANSQALTGAVNRSRLTRIPDVGHAVHLEAPGAIADAIALVLTIRPA